MSIRSENDYVHRPDGITEIRLLHGLVAVIDTEDFELVKVHRWHAARYRDKWYVYANIRSGTNKCGYSVLGLHVLLAGDGSLHVDHCDGDGMNNRRYNLRRATRSQNKFNSRKETRGVYLFTDRRSKPWQAYIGFRDETGRHKKTCYFETERQAREARLIMEQVVYGDFRRLHSGA